MCGRFAQTTSPEELVKIFGLTSTFHIVPRFNIAPTQSIIAIREHQDSRYAHQFRWGFVPPWAEDLRFGNKMINARAETVFEKRSFAHAARHQRCVIPASGFYEWRDTPAGRMPTLFMPQNESVLRFAGIWSSWADQDGSLTYTVTILTVPANRVMQPFHHRMPAILNRRAANTWLDAKLQNSAELNPILQPAPPDALHLRPVSTRINSVRNDGPKCWDCAEPAMLQ